MAGIYFHIPFCKQACHYCDFHFSTNFRNVEDLVSSMKRELVLQKEYLQGEIVETIYFGGGTPSSISSSKIGELIDEVRRTFEVAEDSEITLEANPDDLNRANLEAWKQAGVNRLSVGVQSFVDEHLQWMNRSHSAQQVISGLQLAKDIGFSNITMDLIYGIPGMTMDQWEANIEKFLVLGLPHLSAYGLTIESKTHLGHLAKTHQMNPEEDWTYNAQFGLLMDLMNSRGFEHYEISNFALPGQYSRHNTAYWFGTTYLGIGPSAHSFDGHSRQWNSNSNLKYIRSISEGGIPAESEILSVVDQYNEYVLTHLRTQWGISENQIKMQFGANFQNNIKLGMTPFLASGHLEKRGENYVLTREGKFLADKIAADLFMIE
jgi:oxygen-independent coproporphyrinogen-3 oxidase